MALWYDKTSHPGANYNMGTSNPYSLGGSKPVVTKPYQYSYLRADKTNSVLPEGTWIIRRAGGGEAPMIKYMPSSWNPNSPVNTFPWQQTTSIGSDASRQASFNSGIGTGSGATQFNLMRGQFFNEGAGMTNPMVSSQRTYHTKTNPAYYAQLYRKLMGGY